MLDLDEASILDPLFKFRTGARVAADLVAAVQHLQVPFAHGAVVCEGAAVGVVFVVEVVEFDPASGGGMSVWSKYKVKA